METPTTTRDERDDVQGYAISCEQALGLAKGYIAISGVMGALGIPSLQASYAGRAMGVLEAGCPK